MWLTTKEYGELCHAIWNKYFGKIPETGYLVYKNYFYVYTYDMSSYKIFFNTKLPYLGYEDDIDEMIRGIENER